MIIAALFFLGLCLGSFVNALVWRVHEQSVISSKAERSRRQKRGSSTAVGMTTGEELSILRGRSMCPNCRHTLAAKDLVPVLSWLSTGGKCRYCGKKISIQYPLVEISTGLAFVVSYLFWPSEFGVRGSEFAEFGLWLLILAGLMALLVYDLRWYLLPNRILYPLAGLASLLAVIEVATAAEPTRAVIDTALAVLIGGGLFYVLFQISKGKWIGGGDVKLGWLLGLIVATPSSALLMIFIAALLGTIVSLPLLVNQKLKRTSVIPFGPFLIIGAFIAMLFGADIIDWYLHSLLMI